MSNVILRMFKVYDEGEDSETVVDIRIRPNGEIWLDEQQSTYIKEKMKLDLDFKVISQLITVRWLEIHGWALRPAHSWEEAEV
jgi:hypothetical protein